MKKRTLIIWIIAGLCLINSPTSLADCPSVDLTGDCFVDFEDFAILMFYWLDDNCQDPNWCEGADLNHSNTTDFFDFAMIANDWLTGNPNVPEDMTYIPDGEFEMGDAFNEGFESELPVHTASMDAFFMGKYEVTNGQYCQYLNSALGNSIYVSGDVVYGSENNQPYCDTHAYDSDSQIDYSGSVFTVRTKPEVGGRDMSNDPMVEVSWYGAVAYCNWRSQQEGKQLCYNLSTWACDFNKKGYRLATEAEWEYAARGGLSGKRFTWGDTITHSQANYYSSGSYSYDISPTEGFHPVWNDGIEPYTSPTGSFSDNGLRVYDMAGNVWEWCNDWYSDTYYSSSPTNNPTGPTSGTSRVLRSGGWGYGAYFCRAATRYSSTPATRYGYFGFRLAIDLE